MKYAITEIEGLRIHEGTPDQYIIGITQATIERIFKLCACPMEALALYALYASTCKWQQNQCAYATEAYVLKKSGWGRDRFRKAKKELIDRNLIRMERRTDKETGRFTGTFVRVMYATSISQEFHSPENPPSGKQTTYTQYLQGETKYKQIEAMDEYPKSSLPTKKSYKQACESFDSFHSTTKDKRPEAEENVAFAEPPSPKIPRSPLPPQEVTCDECGVKWVSPDPFLRLCPSCEDRLERERESDEIRSQLFGE